MVNKNIKCRKTVTDVVEEEGGSGGLALKVEVSVYLPLKGSQVHLSVRAPQIDHLVLVRIH
jgi:hypothetical protein